MIPLWHEQQTSFSPGTHWQWVTHLHCTPGCCDFITFWTSTYHFHVSLCKLKSTPLNCPLDRPIAFSYFSSVCKNGDHSLPLSILLWIHYYNLQGAEIFQCWGSLTDTSPIPQRYLPFSFSPNIVRKTVKLIGPGASFTMASSSSFLTFRRPAAEIIFHNKSQIVLQKTIPIHLLPLGAQGSVQLC